MMTSTAVHLTLAILWIGVLLTFLAAVFTSTGKRPSESTKWFGVQTLKWLSMMGLLVLAAVFVTGLKAAHPLIDKNYAAVFVTHSGWLLIGKLAIVFLVLAITLWIHFILLPALATNTETATATKRTLRTWVVIEGVCTLALIWAGHVVANDHPPNHAVVYDWPYPFRFSIANTWGMGMLDAVIGIWAAMVLLIVAGGIALLAQMKGWRLSWRLGLPTVLTISALAVGSYALAVEAFPETYRQATVPFKSESVAHAMTIFAENCVPCHGHQAKGDGILSKTLPKKPVDLLTEPHAGMHTPGDFFHWLTNGIPGTGMPPWGEKFSVKERWDLVNFVHALSRGYQARIINTRVLPNQPYLAPPGFSYTTHDGHTGRLKDFRGENAVLLVLFSWPDSRERLDQLRLAYQVLRDHKTEVLAVPLTDLTPEQTALITEDPPFPLVVQGAAEIARTYSLFRRTISNPDLMGEGTVPTHMEFLFDRFGYLRARWIPETDGPDWTDIDFLTQQVDQLNQEKEILPPPADYVHDAADGMHMGMDMGGMKM
ncbi:MAG: CopD family protein [Nitrospira sp.]|nr:CopD family protein [Nitrospira sp.]MDH4370572.1 CopD family protein [Nitrospira sp.]